MEGDNREEHASSDEEIAVKETVPSSPSLPETSFSKPEREIKTDTIPQKRPVGRPRKHPLPPNYVPPPPKPRPSSIYHELEAQGISAKDIQKYLLKKKVKKYVQQYVQKYQAPTYNPAQSKRQAYYEEDEEEEEEDEEDNIEEIEEESEDEYEGVNQGRSGGMSANLKTQGVPNTKLNQILGHTRRQSSQPRYSTYRF
jgi:ribosomal protein L12E/L44/L45/RPP1/RPP2